MSVAAIPGVQARHATSKALLCRIGWRELWVPLSQIEFGSEVRRAGDSGALLVSAWWAERAGLAHEPEAPPALPARLPKSEQVYKRIIFEVHPDRNHGDGTAARCVNALWQAVQKEIGGCP